VTDLCRENYRTLNKEIEENTRRWKDLPCSSMGRINTVKMTTLPEAIYTFNAIPIKIPMSFLREIEKSVIKFICLQKTTNSQSILSKKSNVGGITIPAFK
jgi:hypothetical protein